MPLRSVLFLRRLPGRPRDPIGPRGPDRRHGGGVRRGRDSGSSTSRSVCSHHGTRRQTAAAQPRAANSAGRISARSWPASVGTPAAAISSPSRGPTATTSRHRIWGRTLRSRGARPASNSRSASPSSQSAASPVGDKRGGQASSCPSMNSRPGQSLSACRAASAPRITGQSPPTSNGNRPLRRAALTASRTRPIIMIGASSASRPDGPRPGRGAGSARSPASLNPGRLASAAARPRWRSMDGALATPSTVPPEFVGTNQNDIARHHPHHATEPSGRPPRVRAHHTDSRLRSRAHRPARRRTERKAVMVSPPAADHGTTRPGKTRPRT